MTQPVPSLRDLQDRAELTDLISRLYQVLDEQRFDDLASVYTDDVELDFPSGTMHGLTEVSAMARRRAADYRAMQHYNADVLIALHGDTAQLRANHIAVHLQHGDEPAAHFDVGLIHHFEAIRTPEGWRVRGGRAEVRWLTGTPAATT